MDYDEIAAAAGTLGYREKLKLAQVLIQRARQEEESASAEADGTDDHEAIAARLHKLRPKSRRGLVNSIKAMYQFRGGISDEAVAERLPELRRFGITVDADGRVTYA